MLNTVTKGEFARMVNLSPGRVSQLIKDGRIADCLVGEGREARVDAEKAIEKLKLRRDLGQALGNGAKTQLVMPAPTTAAPMAISESDEISLKLQRAKLEEAEFRNRKLREEQRARAGTYVLAEDVKAETARLASRMLQLFESGMMDVATEIASTFKLPQRDVLHMLKTKIRHVRANVSAELASEAETMPAAIEQPNPINA
jgi:hypothetical protein